MRALVVFRLVVALAVAAVLVVVAMRSGSGPSDAPARGEAGVSSGSVGREVAAASLAPVPDGSTLRDLPGLYTDAEGRTVPFRELVGEPFVLSLVYTRCPTVCPRTLAELRSLERAAGSEAPPRFVLVSLDPEHDSPEALAEFAREHELPPDRWRLLRPERAALSRLATSVGVAWAAAGEGAVAHSAVVAFVDGEGRLRARHVGLGTPTARLLEEWRAIH